ncbi:uncharacterized protein Tco025E_04765 [Trypanosoma conorhini]|uniref:Vacuolar sorting protein 39/Transforming growth factor beta receptor-associated zinc finger domain-containing protein n=1 Tax=Trypanosoma conorhini TaxID=83891 RepID=A0A422PJ45_9TRYP|nr:uncharacterized protein Tco025E_04765 [Trypanosoma conorhini]RNF17729.1 hypothetical protein Tco025E_04765 [Trypanosoma conorhini]
MERQTLFVTPHEKIHVTAAAVFPVERSSGEPVARDMHLSPGEELRSLLYAGCSDGTLHVYRFITCLDQEEVRYDVRTALLHKKSLSTPHGKNAVEDKGNNRVSHGITFLSVNSRLSVPQLLVLADGSLDALHCGGLDSTGLFRQLPLPSGAASVCCVARGQDHALHPAQRLALLIGKWIALVEYGDRKSWIFQNGTEAQGAAATEPLHILAPEDTQTMAWQCDFILTGSLKEYCVFDVNTRHLRQRMEVVENVSQGPLCRYVHGIGDSSAVVIRIGDGRLALFDAAAETDLETATPVQLSEAVVDVAWVPPFFVGVRADGGVLMRSWLDAEEEFPRFTASASASSILGFDGAPQQFHSTPLGIYGVCGRSVQLLLLAPRRTIAALYINAGLYERALRYVDHVHSEEKDIHLRRVYKVCAHHALVGKRYTEAFHYFELASTPTLELLELVPELRRPPRAADALNAKTSLTWGSGEAYHEMYELLLRRRSVGLGSRTEEQRAVEFAIFLLYVLECVPYTDDELADMFLLSSTLDPVECLRYVSEDGVRPKPMILPLVLACDGRFSEALQRCQALRLVHEAAVVLQMSGDEALYVQHFPWMLSADISSALLAVLRPQRRPPSAATILPMLLGYGGCPLHDYLHLLIFVEGNTQRELHTLYATNLIDIIRSLQSFGVAGLKAPAVKLRAGEESGVRGAARRALLKFLQLSPHYEVDVVLAMLHGAGMVEEEVLAMEQAGDHIGALTKLVYELADVAAAVRYCVEQHSRELQRLSRGASQGEVKDSGCSDPALLPAPAADSQETFVGRDDSVWLAGSSSYAVQGGRTFNEHFNTLLHVLLVPPAGKERMLSEALWVLNEHSRCINPLSVMTSLPSEVCVAEISSYLLRAFQTLCSQAQLAEVNANSVASMLADAQRQRALLAQRCVYVDEKRPCAVCGKPLGVGVMAVFPNLKATHFRCFHAQELDPERGVPFRPGL